MSTTGRPQKKAPTDRSPDPPPPGSGSARGGSAPTVIDQMGGPRGFLYSVVPVVVFVAANAFLPLPLTIGIAIGTGLALFGFRLLRGEPLTQALGSVLGVAIAAGLVAWTGSARDFFAIGIWLSLAGFVVAAGSVLARRPVTGVVWNLVHGRRYAWRADRATLRAHDLATTAAAVVLGARFVVQQWLYLADDTTGLGIARVAMGVPLTVTAALVIVWAFRRSTARLIARRR